MSDLAMLLAANGISESTFHQKPQSITRLEMVLDEFNKMTCIRFFPGLRSLCLTHQGISVIEGLDVCTQLEELWLSENVIAEIKGLSQCQQLKQLYLNGNKISKIQNLEQLTNLEVLWLSDNQIPAMENFETLTNLRHLSLAGNQIELIGNVLDPLTKLEELDLSANKIGSFKEVLNLIRLPNLKTLAFHDPHWSENPLCNLCNYQTYILYHFPQLQYLDSLSISDEAKALAESTYMKKRMYYNMRIKTLKRNCSNVIRKAEEAKKGRLATIQRDITILTKQRKDVERELEERKYIPGYIPMACYGEGPRFDDSNPSNIVSLLNEKATVLTGRTHDRNEDLHDTETLFRSFKRRVCETSEQNIHRLLLELETGGNIRYEEGKPSDLWYSSCVELVHSRFLSSDFAKYGIIGLKVLRVTRIHNRFLRNRFEENVDGLVDTTDPLYKRSLEYLFYGMDPLASGEFSRAAEEGFRSSFEYQQLGLPPAVPLTNSVSTADIPRLQSYLESEDGQAATRAAMKSMRSQRNLLEGIDSQTRSSRATGSDSAISKGCVRPPTGQILINKVFLSKVIADSKTPLYTDKSPTKLFNAEPIDTTGLEDYNSIYRSKLTDSKQRLWFVLDHSLILPEYLVDFDYIMKDESIQKGGSATTVPSQAGSSVGSDSPSEGAQTPELTPVVNHATFFAEMEKSDLAALAIPLADFIKQCANPIRLNVSLTTTTPSSAAQQADKEGGSVISSSRASASSSPNSEYLDAVLTMPPNIQPRPTVNSIGSDVVMRACQTKQIHNIVYLNLHGNRIKKIENLNEFVQLKILILSFNEIGIMQNMDELTRLERLELGYNFIKRIEGVSTLSSLKHLELNNNMITSLEELSMLNRFCNNLQLLFLRDNPCSEAKNYRPTVLQRVPSLTHLDGQLVTDSERESAGEASTSTVTMNMIRENSYVHKKHAPNGFAYGSGHGSLVKLVGADSSSTLSNISNISHMSSSISSSSVSAVAAGGVLPSPGRRNRSPSPTISIQDGTDVSWLEKVEVLELNHQGLTKLQNLNRLTNLRRGSFVDNEISKIEGLENCRRLEELSLEENLLVRLEGLSHLKYLKKLDLGKNRIVSLDGLEGLDSLSQLALEDNEISSLSGLANLKNLMELYIGNNRISDIREIHHLKEVPKLIILDVSGNGLCQSEEYRLYIIFHLKAKLKVLDGISVDTNEQMTAKEKFSGKLTLEVVEQKLIGRSFKDVRDLDLSACRIREVDDIFNESTFPNLRDLNLDNNLLTSMRCFGLMPKLQVLHLNHNKLETLSVTAITDIPAHGDRLEVRGLLGLPSLEVLQLSHNHLIELSGLQVARLRELKILWLHNNELTKVEGLEHLVQLRELTLDKNRIRALEPHSFVNLHQLRELRLEENGLRSLSFFLPLPRLQSLFLAFNRITDVGELEKLAELPMLVELTLSSNPVARKQLYRPTLVRKMPTLKYLDGREIIMDERERVEMLFASDGKPAAMIHYQEPVRIQSQIQQKVPVKLTSLNFEGLPTLREKSPTPPLSVGPMLSSMMPHSNAIGMSVGGIGVGGGGMGMGMGVGVSPAAMLVLKDTQAAAHQWQNGNTMSLGMSAARQEQLSYQPMSQSHHIQASFEGLDVSKSDVVPRRDRVDRTGITRRPSSGGPNMHSRGVYPAPVSLIPNQTASRPTVPPPSLAGNGSSGPYMLFNAAPTSGSVRSSIPISMSTQTSSKPPVPDSAFLLKSNTTFSTANKPAVGSLLSGSSGRRLSNPLRSTQSPRPFPISKR